MAKKPARWFYRLGGLTTFIAVAEKVNHAMGWFYLN
ncbi:MAG: hypothetical protein ACI8TQ_000441 [Planctomycetota bacterium]|jgi:hypothetical protein